MDGYQIELKQIVSFPRCRIYRQFIRSLMADRSIRVNGCSLFFYYMVLCSFANYQTSYQSYDGIRYIIFPGEWICPLAEVAGWFRQRTRCGTLEVLYELQERHLIEVTLLGRDKLVKFKISGWKKSNRIIEEHAPCQKDMGFFFFPVARVHELVSIGRCSEMDIVLDLWIHAIYNDPRVQGSELGPVVYFRNNTGNPLTSYSDMAARWGISRSTVCRLLNKLEGLGYLRLIAFSGRHGSTIYLNSYLSTMFGVSDVMIDKEEVSLALNIKTDCGQAVAEELPELDEAQICVSQDVICVSKSDMTFILRKVAQILTAQGFSRAGCSRTVYRLSSLSPDCREALSLRLSCGNFVEFFTLKIQNNPPRPDRAAAAQAD